MMLAWDALSAMKPLPLIATSGYTCTYCAGMHCRLLPLWSPTPIVTSNISSDKLAHVHSFSAFYYNNDLSINCRASSYKIQFRYSVTLNGGSVETLNPHYEIASGVILQSQLCKTVIFLFWSKDCILPSKHRDYSQVSSS
jgi:hypothetical protein